MTPKLKFKGNYTPNLLFESLSHSAGKKQKPPQPILIYVHGRQVVVSSALLASGGHSLESVLREMHSRVSHSLSLCGFIAPSATSDEMCSRGWRFANTFTSTLFVSTTLLFRIAQGGAAAAAAAENDSKMLTTGPNFLGGRLCYGFMMTMINTCGSAEIKNRPLESHSFGKLSE
jgi:hypothetical protein